VITASLVSFESNSEIGIYFAATKKKKFPHEESPRSRGRKPSNLRDETKTGV
jgi:hypothetical protein